MKKYGLLVLFLILILFTGCQKESEQLLVLNNTDIDKTYNESITSFQLTNAEDLELIVVEQEAYVYFGRESCPYCLTFAPQLSDFSKKEHLIYYIDTENIDNDPTLLEMTEYYEIEVVPSLVKIYNKGKDFEHFSINYEGTNDFLSFFQ